MLQFSYRLCIASLFQGIWHIRPIIAVEVIAFGESVFWFVEFKKLYIWKTHDEDCLVILIRKKFNFWLNFSKIEKDKKEINFGGSKLKPAGFLAACSLSINAIRRMKSFLKNTSWSPCYRSDFYFLIGTSPQASHWGPRLQRLTKR